MLVNLPQNPEQGDIHTAPTAPPRVLGAMRPPV